MARTNETSKLIEILEVMEPEGKPLRGYEVCFTGHMSKPRKEWEELVEVAGGHCVKTVAYGTTLVTNEDWTTNSVGSGGSSKYKAAKRNRCRILNEQQLISMLTASQES
jgi:NAD-dependent DNA ligase